MTENDYTRAMAVYLRRAEARAARDNLWQDVNRWFRDAGGLLMVTADELDMIRQAISAATAPTPGAA